MLGDLKPWQIYKGPFGKSKSQQQQQQQLGGGHQSMMPGMMDNMKMVRLSF